MRLPPPSSRAEYVIRVDCLCALHEASTTSTRRTASRNARVGGAATSKHLLSRGGWADDLVPDDMRAERRQAMVRDAQTLGLWALDEDDHVHVQGLPPDVAGGQG